MNIQVDRTLKIAAMMWLKRKYDPRGRRRESVPVVSMRERGHRVNVVTVYPGVGCPNRVDIESR